eukprot:c18758_g1_i2 orf=563-1051(-)
MLQKTELHASESWKLQQHCNSSASLLLLNNALSSYACLDILHVFLFIITKDDQTKHLLRTLNEDAFDSALRTSYPLQKFLPAESLHSRIWQLLFLCFLTFIPMSSRSWFSTPSPKSPSHSASRDPIQLFMTTLTSVSALPATASPTGSRTTNAFKDFNIFLS